MKKSRRVLEMFCPKCATQNIDGASFCRSCGANISLIPHALSGQLPQAQEANEPRSRSRRRENWDRDVEPSVEKGIVNIFMGLGFMVAALAVMYRFPGGIFWGWSLLIPAFSCFGRGVASIVSARRSDSANSKAGAFLPPAHSGAIPTMRIQPGAPRTGELMPPVPSVTERTTRHLGTEAPTQHFDSLES